MQSAALLCNIARLARTQFASCSKVRNPILVRGPATLAFASATRPIPARGLKPTRLPKPPVPPLCQSTLWPPRIMMSHARPTAARPLFI
jgi:hypothetical protein